jgi:geranylgeranyl diphosphate synthase type II
MNQIERYQAIAEVAIKNYDIKHYPQGLYDPIKYVLNLGGKRLRPALCMAACHYFSGDGNKAKNAALGLEVFHNFTLLHDDIMDSATIRRNNPTVHLRWNVNTAILSGDAMMIKASQLMLDVPDQYLRPIQELYLKTGLEVCEGQQLDMDFETTDKVEIQQYLEMIRLKTAVLISASLKAGAIIGGADQKDCNLIQEFGQNLGLAFQLQDDYLDAYSENEKFGKNIGGDIVSNKKTFLLISCLEQANSEQIKIIEGWIKCADPDPEKKITAILSVYNQLGIPEKCREQMANFYNNAIKCVDLLSIKPEYKQELKEFAAKLMERTY